MKRRMVISFTIGVICLAGLSAWWLDAKGSPPRAPAPAPPVPVIAEKVRVSDMPIVLSGIGSAVAYNVVDVHTQVTGTIEKIGFTEGQTVHPGSLIAQLDPRPFQAAVDQAQANLERDQAHLTNAEANLARYVPLLSKGFSTQQQVDDQSAAVRELQAAIASDKAAMFNA
ncbi:MAG: biotin/lipoyl-binding protein, partial [Acetobacteraceae bacterium]|nr:biotin/lipoyl-binding protein [Acetobacteraceae bacterium]